MYGNNGELIILITCISSSNTKTTCPTTFLIMTNIYHHDVLLDLVVPYLNYKIINFSFFKRTFKYYRFADGKKVGELRGDIAAI